MIFLVNLLHENVVSNSRHKMKWNLFSLRFCELVILHRHRAHFSKITLSVARTKQNCSAIFVLRRFDYYYSMKCYVSKCVRTYTIAHENDIIVWINSNNNTSWTDDVGVDDYCLLIIRSSAKVRFHIHKTEREPALSSVWIVSSSLAPT